MYKGKVMNNEDNGNDLRGFKGIFVRYDRMFTIELNKTELVEFGLLGFMTFRLQDYLQTYVKHF